MTPTAADGIAKRIINCWHGGPRLDEWVDTLTPLDEGTAGTTFVRLRAELEHAPSIARYLATYRALRTPANQPIAPPTQPRGAALDAWVRKMRWDERTPIPADHQRARAAFDAGYAQGQAELWELSGGKLGSPPQAGYMPGLAQSTDMPERTRNDLD